MSVSPPYRRVLDVGEVSKLSNGKSVLVDVVAKATMEKFLLNA